MGLQSDFGNLASINALLPIGHGKTTVLVNSLLFQRIVKSMRLLKPDITLPLDNCCLQYSCSFTIADYSKKSQKFAPTAESYGFSRG